MHSSQTVGSVVRYGYIYTSARTITWSVCYYKILCISIGISVWWNPQLHWNWVWALCACRSGSCHILRGSCSFGRWLHLPKKTTGKSNPYILYYIVAKLHELPVFSLIVTVHVQLYTRDITPFMQYFQHYADILTKGLKKQHRWFGGWDIGRRLPFVFFGYFLGVARPSLVLVCCNVMITMCVCILSCPWNLSIW